MIDYDEAIKDVTTYQKQMVLIRDVTDKRKNLNQDAILKLQIDYERLVRPYAEEVGMHEPGEKEWHGYKLKYDNPAEWAIKEGSFFSLNNGITFLNRLIGRLEYYKARPEQFKSLATQPVSENALARIQQVIRMFDTSAKILAERRKGKEPITIKDEYDMQDVLHCILKSQFPDIKPEESAPSIANGQKRIDLVIPSTRIVIELKIIFKNDKKNRTSQLVDELN